MIDTAYLAADTTSGTTSRQQRCVCAKLAVGVHEGDDICLNTHCLSETHLVSQDAVEAILVEGDEPAHPTQLVATHLPLHQRKHGLQCTARVKLHHMSLLDSETENA